MHEIARVLNFARAEYLAADYWQGGEGTQGLLKLIKNQSPKRRSKWNLKNKKLFKLSFLSNFKCQLMGIPVRADRMQFAVEQTVGRRAVMHRNEV